MMTTLKDAVLSPSFILTTDKNKIATYGCYSEDGIWLAVSYNIGIIEIYRVEDWQLCFVLDKKDPQKHPFTSMSFRPTGGTFTTRNVLISTDTMGDICHWHATSGKLMSTIKEPGDIFTVAQHETNALFATGGLDAKVRIYDGQTMQLSKVLNEGDSPNILGHTSRIFSIRWSPIEPDVLLSGGWDKTIQIWDLRVGKSVRSISGPYLCGDSLDVNERRGAILTGSWRPSEQLQEWDYGSGKLIRSFNWPPNMEYNMSCHLYSARYGRNALHSLAIAGGSNPNQAAMFHTGNGQVLGNLQESDKGVLSVNFDSAGTQMCIVSANQVLAFNMREFAFSKK